MSKIKWKIAIRICNVGLNGDLGGLFGEGIPSCAQFLILYLFSGITDDSFWGNTFVVRDQIQVNCIQENALPASLQLLHFTGDFEKNKCKGVRKMKSYCNMILFLLRNLFSLTEFFRTCLFSPPQDLLWSKSKALIYLKAHTCGHFFLLIRWWSITSHSIIYLSHNLVPEKYFLKSGKEVYQ